ncbi:MAG: pitrilysin family protein [Bacillota bacterium]|nr:pitrilysin family protein [Bacillota bacterium]
MEEFVLDNGIKLICDSREGKLTSFCIGFNAGALEEEGFSLGTAHAVEHMVFKGTAGRSERQINDEMDNYFGFSNAMTNYPYAIYYGTVSSNDFAKGFELYCDILLNPVFPSEGFEEEIRVIMEELRDWKEDFSQRCEDLLFSNSFSRRRIRELIIGNEASVKNITLDEIKNFYSRFYSPENCIITVVTSLKPQDIFAYVNEIMGLWNNSAGYIRNVDYEKNKPGIYTAQYGTESARLQVCFDIHDLTDRELFCLYAFNMEFGEGTSSMLYNEVRTVRGLAYEVGSSVKNERGIRLFSIQLSTSIYNIDEALETINNCLKEAKKRDWTEKGVLERAVRRFRLKEGLALERSVEQCKRMAAAHLMYGNYRLGMNGFYEYNIDGSEVREVVEKVLQKPSIQILKI